MSVLRQTNHPLGKRGNPVRFQMAVCSMVLGVSAGVRMVDACDCAPPPPPKQAMEGASSVFLAEVVKVEKDGGNRSVTLRVKRWWKGGDSETLTVSTAKDGRSCGYEFVKGSRYLIYADVREKDKSLWVHLCSRTSTVEEAEKNGDFKALGEGKVPAPKPKGKKH
jgi:hypothetical protein